MSLVHVGGGSRWGAKDERRDFSLLQEKGHEPLGKQNEVSAIK